MNYVAPAEIADRLSVTKDTVYKWCRNGTLRSYKFGGSLRVAEAELERFINESAVSPSDPMPAPKPAAKRGRFAEIVDLQSRRRAS